MSGKLLRAGAGAIASLLLAGGCSSGGGVSEDVLRSDATAVARSLSLAPMGSAPVEAQRVKVKADPAYYVVTGIRSEPAAAARASVVARLRSLGWNVVETRDGESFLGWQARATKGDAVLRALVGSGTGGASGTPYPPLHGRSYVQVAVAGQDSGPGWSSVSSLSGDS